MNMDTRENLAKLHHAFAYMGWTDAIFTHISARIPTTDKILMKPFSLLFDEVTPENLIEFDIYDITKNTNSEDVNEPGWNIHSAIHEGRPEVEFVAHVHTPEIVAVSACPDGLRHISQYSHFIKDKISYHPYEGIVFFEDEKSRIIDSMGNNKYMLLENHGSIVVGDTVEQCFFRQYMLQRACEVQTKVQGNDFKQIEDISREEELKLERKLSPTKMLWDAITRKMNK